MTQRIDRTTGIDQVWELLDGQVAAGRMPGYVAALRVRGQVAVRAAGRTALDDTAPPMRDDTLFRIASITKPMGGALTLTLVRDGVLALDDPIGRWLPEAADAAGARRARTPRSTTPSPADRPVTVRDLLTGTSGWGCVMERDAAAGGDDRARGVPGPAAPRRDAPTSSSRASRACRWPSSRARAGCTRPASTCSAFCSCGPPAGRWRSCSPSGSPGRSA